MAILFQHCGMFKDQMSNWYEISVHQFLRDIDNLLEIVEVKCKIVMLAMKAKRQDKRSLEHLRSDIRSKSISCNDSFYLMKYYLDHPEEAFLPDFIPEKDKLLFKETKALVSGQCKDEIESGFREILHVMGILLSDTSTPLTLLRNMLVKLAKEITSYTNNKIKCLTNYKNILQSAIEWTERSKELINTVLMKMGNILKSTRMVFSSYKNMKSSLENMASFIDKYVFDTYTQENYDSLFKNLTTISTEIDLFRDEIQITFRLNYYVPVQDLQELMKNEYQRALQTTLDVVPVLGNFYYWDLLNSMAIWKFPKPNFNRPKQYRDQGRELWRVWNPETSFIDFVHERSNGIIDEAVEGYFQPIFDQMKDFEKFIIRQSNDLKQRLNMVFENYGKQKKMTTIDEGFVR